MQTENQKIVNTHPLNSKCRARNKTVNQKKLAQILADSYSQDWVGTEDYPESVLDSLLKQGFLQGKHIHESKYTNTSGNKHYFISEKGIRELEKTNFFEIVRGDGIVDIRKIRFLNTA